MRPNSDAPIGIFDSGIGGLTVAYAIKKSLPKERMIYYGDTAHLPYGDKSEAAIQACSVKIADFLLGKGCKVIVIACNSASSAAYELLKEFSRKKARIVNVIDPMVNYVHEHYPKGTIGLIGTKRTVASNIYAEKIKDGGNPTEVNSLATPLLVPLIEEGFFNNKISREIIENYLQNPVLKGLSALILGCTHYPLIKDQVDNFYAGKVEVLDSSRVVAQSLKGYLTAEQLLGNHEEPHHEFYVSDYTDSFEASTKIFFRELVSLQKVALFD